MAQRGGKRAGAGRPKGIIDKRSLKLQDKLIQLKYDPIQTIVNFTKSADEGVALRASIAIFEACVPKLKATEIESHSVNSKRPSELTNEALEEIEGRFIRPETSGPAGTVVH